MPEARHPGRYDQDVLAGDWKAPPRGRSTEAPADLGIVVEEVTSGWVGEVVRVERDLGMVMLEDRHLRRKSFPLGPGFLLEGRPVVLVAPVAAAPKARVEPLLIPPRAFVASWIALRSGAADPEITTEIPRAIGPF